MRKRTLSREFALKALYVYDVRGDLSEEKLQALAESEDLNEVPQFGRELARGVIEQQQMLDEIVQNTAENWRLDRMPIVDRNILRLGTYELLFQADTPPKVAINEAIEMAKKFSTENSPMFVNGVLDKIFTTHAEQRPEPGETTEIEQPRRFPPLPCKGIEPDPMQRADLHLHTTRSDGSCHPPELVKMAVEADLKAISVADHDSVQAIEATRKLCEEFDIHLVPGVELTAYSRGESRSGEYELHLLGYFIDETDPYFLQALADLKRIRVERIEKMVTRLRELGLDLSAEDVFQHVDDGSAGRVHVAQELVRREVVSDIKEAFNRYLAEDKPAYVAKKRLTPAEAIHLIHEAGGVAVLAHPGAGPSLREKLEELEEAGLDGIEVHYPGHSAEQEAYWLDAARKLDLVVTGGSDFHGEAKPHIRVAQETVSLVEVCDLRARAKQYRRRGEPA